ncbi:MAG: DegT/DnrJ/EryC1/StrS family aminotransferase [Candidatus Omnitrophica bacterium]|nr:DegT/DnrJ/EryC1/StrS family aminotransferase [Candidatus Omnitrophota bacterium]
MKIPLSAADITEKEISAVVNVLNGERLSMGNAIVKFEKIFTKYTKRKYAVAVNSGTSALHLIVRALGLQKGDEVITTPFSFIASSNCLLFEDVTPVFVDIERETYNIDVSKIEEKITQKTKAILAVDVFGVPALWDKLIKIAKKHKLKLIQDSCEALGAEFKGRKIGSFGDAATFAFYPNKQITTAEGGMVLTDNKNIADLCKSMRNQGRDNMQTWFGHVRLGYNYRLSEMQAALGIVQMTRIKEILKKREIVAKYYEENLKDIPGIKIPENISYGKRSWFVYVIELGNKFNRKDRDKIMKLLRGQGVSCSNYFSPIHLQPFYRKLFNFKRGYFPVTDYVSDRTIALPFFNKLTEKKVIYITQKLKKIILSL